MVCLRIWVCRQSFATQVWLWQTMLPLIPASMSSFSAVQTNEWLEEKLFLSVYFNKLVIYTTAWARPTHSSTWAGCRLKCK